MCCIEIWHLDGWNSHNKTNCQKTQLGFFLNKNTEKMSSWPKFTFFWIQLCGSNGNILSSCFYHGFLMLLQCIFSSYKVFIKIVSNFKVYFISHDFFPAMIFQSKLDLVLDSVWITNTKIFNNFPDQKKSVKWRMKSKEKRQIKLRMNEQRWNGKIVLKITSEI